MLGLSPILHDRVSGICLAQLRGLRVAEIRVAELRREERASGAHAEGESQMSVPMKSLTAGVFLLLGAVPAMAVTQAHERPLVLPPSVSSGECITNAAKYSVSTDLQKSATKQFRN